MNTDTLKIFTQKAPGQSHRETVVTIDWEGMDLEMFRCLARSCVLHMIQCQFKKGILPIPEELKVRGCDFIRQELHDLLIPVPNIIKERKTKPAVDAIGWVEKMLLALPEGERARMIAELEGQKK